MKKPNSDRSDEEPSSSRDLWVAPRSNLRGPDGDRAWGGGNIPPATGQRFLELADIALGLKKPEKHHGKSPDKKKPPKA